MNIYKEVNISHIARVAGMSLSTVSRALRGDPATSKKTTEKILKIARDLNYYPDYIARGLRQKKTNTVGIIFNDPNNPFYTEILRVIDEVLTEKDYSMVVSYSNWNLERERKNIITLLSKRVDGVIISPIYDEDENLKILLENQMETVLIDCLPHFPNVNYVYTDNIRAGEIATEHLIKNGHKNIMLFTFAQKFSQVNTFEQGYMQTLQKYGIKVREELIVSAAESSIDCGYETFKKIITENTTRKALDFTGIVTISDMFAIGIYEVANEMGIDIPGTYSVVGYDNIRFTKALTPPLTTVHQPRRRIGLESANILLHNINSEDKVIKNTTFEPYLVQRGSVKNIS